jgi:hypothetical protein
MRVLRGTFRLSVLVALMVAAYYGITAHVAAHNADREDRKHWSTLRCGERFLGQDMSKYTSPYREEVIDIGKAGCSNSSFWATFDEIHMAIAQPDPPEDRYNQVFWPELYNALFLALGVFLIVNLLGLLSLGARGALRWVRAGYR